MSDTSSKIESKIERLIETYTYLSDELEEFHTRVDQENKLLTQLYLVQIDITDPQYDLNITKHNKKLKQQENKVTSFKSAYRIVTERYNNCIKLFTKYIDLSPIDFINKKENEKKINELNNFDNTNYNKESKILKATNINIPSSPQRFTEISDQNFNLPISKSEEKPIPKAEIPLFSKETNQYNNIFELVNEYEYVIFRHHRNIEKE
jgi:hypothetical protein